MSGFAGRTVGIVGALEAFPRRMATRAVMRQGGQLRRGALRGTSVVVFGRKGLNRPARLVAARSEALAAGREVLSENGFLRRLGLLPAAPGGPHGRAAMVEMSKLPGEAFDMLALYDAFENDAAPYSFRDLILARKYAELMAGGAPWDGIARAVHRVPDVGTLTALSLDLEARSIVARRSGWVGELDGQGLFALDGTPDADDAFDAAETAEAEGDLVRAAALYNRCLSLDPTDSVAAFNRANCLRELGQLTEAAADYSRAVKLDKGFAEAWFNLAGLMVERGQPESARRHLACALEADAGYADAMFNLARLDFEAGLYDEARLWWQRYLERDGQGEWAQRARNGLALIAMQVAG